MEHAVGFYPFQMAATRPGCIRGGTLLIDVIIKSIYNEIMFLEWDEAKRQSNIQKHGVDFVDIPVIFEGDMVVIEDARYDYGENRFIAVGILKSRVIVVAYTERGDNIRIISARKATKNEQIFFFQKI